MLLDCSIFCGLYPTDDGTRGCCCCSVTQLCPTLCNPMDCSTPGFPVLQYLPEFKLMSIESKMPPNHLILCHPVLLLPSIFPSIRVFSSESALCIRWPKYWSFTFSISPSNKQLWLISFKIDCFETQESPPAPQFKSISSLVLNLLYDPCHSF